MCEKRIHIYIHVTGKVTEYYEAANMSQQDKSSSECVLTYKWHQNVLIQRLDLDLNRYFRVDKKNIVELTLDADCQHVGLGWGMIWLLVLFIIIIITSIIITTRHISNWPSRQGGSTPPHLVLPPAPCSSGCKSLLATRWSDNLYYHQIIIR